MIIKNCLNSSFIKTCINRNIRQLSFKSFQLNEIKLDNSNVSENVRLENEPNEEVEFDESIKPRDIYYKFRSKGGNFVDHKIIRASGGKGGDGVASFGRDPLHPKGPPDGGNGGPGGNVIIKVDPNENSLSYLQYRCQAKNGNGGKGKFMHGKRGKDLIIRVPLGTVVREIDPPASKNDEYTIEEDTTISDLTYDLDKDYSKYFRMYPGSRDPMVDFPEPRALKLSRLPKQPKVELDLNIPHEEVMIVKGGLGGFGNPHFGSTINRSPVIAERGIEGEVKYFELELKTIADAGLVGLPNAGKSTFLSAVSNAHPAIAPYPFTTINPYLGTIDYSDLYQVTIADIPGLIKGAHRNMGLGHSFLRHVERSKVLVYVIDISKENPWNDLYTLQEELELYQTNLTNRPSLIIGNKADVPEVTKPNMMEFLKKTDIPIIPVSAKYRKNILKATTKLRELIEQQPGQL